MTINLNGDGKQDLKDEDFNEVSISYGSLDNDNNKFAYGYDNGNMYGGVHKSNGLHYIKLSRELKDDETIKIHWLNGCDLVIFAENGKTKVKRVVSGTYQEIGLLDDDGKEKTVITFGDDISKVRFGYIETKNFQEF